MKLPPAIATSIRHAFTALASLGAFLASHGWLDSADVPAVNAAGASLGDAVGVVVAALVARFVWWVGSQIVSGGGVSSVALLLCGCGAAAVGTLPSCSLPAAGEYPVSAFATYTDPQTGAQVGMQVGQSPHAAPKAKKAKPLTVTASK